MSRRHHAQANRSNRSPMFLSGRRQARRSAALIEALEQRRLLSQPTVFTSVGVGGGGTNYYANMNPKNPADMYLETDMGETWHTTNGGLNWTTINFNFLYSEGNENFVQFTGNTNIQYAINNKATNHEPMVTDNDGQTWAELAGYPNIQASGYFPLSIIADPNDVTGGRIILVTAEEGTGSTYNYKYYFSSEGGADWTSTTQPFSSDTSSTNLNETWTAGAFWDTQLTGHTAAYFATNLGLWESTNVTSATPTWTKYDLPNNTGVNAFYSFTGSATSSGTRLWAVTWDSTDSNFHGHPLATGGGSTAYFTGLWTSTSASTSGSGWTQNTAGPQGTWGTSTSGAQLYPKQVQMVDNNTNDIWIGGDDESTSQESGANVSAIVYESTSAGSSWINLLLTGADYKNFQTNGPSVTSVSITNAGTGYPTSGTVAVTFSAPTGSYYGNLTTATGYAKVNGSGGISSISITNGGFGYTSPPTVTITYNSDTSATGVALDAEAPNQNAFTRAYGYYGGSDNLWDVGLNFFIVDRSSSASSPIMAFSSEGTVFETADGGTNWYDISAGGPETPSQGTTTGAFVQPTDSDHTYNGASEDPYFYGTTTYEFNQEGSNASNPNAQQPSNYYSSSSMEETSTWNMSFANNGNTIFLDETDESYEHSTDGGATWNYPAMATSSSPPNTFYQSVVAPNGYIYAVTSSKHNLYSIGYYDDSGVEDASADDLMMSTDGGETWTLDYTFPKSSPARTITLDPNDADIAFVGTANHNPYPTLSGTNTVGGGIWMTSDLQDGANAIWTYLPEQPTRLLNSTGTAAGSISTFSGVHPVEIYALNSSTSNGVTINLVAVMVGDQSDPGDVTQMKSGIWTGSTTNSGVTWTWTDMSGDNGSTSQFTGGGTNNLPYFTSTLTIDPNDSTQKTWFAATADDTSGSTGDLYKTTNGGATWSVWSTMGQAYSMWIEPGGTQALVGLKYGALEYTSNYTAATPSFTATAFPFCIVNNMVSDPNNPDKVWIMTFGDGLWYTTLTPAVPSTPNVTPDTGDFGVALTWTDANSGSGTDYNIQRSTIGTGGWTTVATGLTNTTWTDNAANDSTYAPLGNTTYYYQVDAYNTNDPSNPSAWSPTSNSALTIPAAPSGLTATPGTNSIALNWVDPSPTTNITGYRIWRSTDNATWGSVYGTASGSSATSFTDASPTAGITYYYEVAAYDTTGNSATAGMTSGVATVYAYEGFNYTVGTGGNSNWNGGTGGVGFSNAWSINNIGNSGVNSGSLVAPAPSNTLTTAGNSAWLVDGSTHTTAIRTLSQSVGGAGTTLWVGFEFSAFETGTGTALAASLDLGISTNEMELGAPDNTLVGAQFVAGGTTKYLSSTTSVTGNTIYFVVYEITYTSSSDVINLYIDPTPGVTAPVNSSASLTLPSSALLTSANVLELQPGALTCQTTFDEIRLGATYGSVAPDPPLAGGNNNRKARRSNPLFSTTSLAPASTPHVLEATRPDWAALIAADDYYPNSPADGGPQDPADAVWTEADNLVLGAKSTASNASWLAAFHN